MLICNIHFKEFTIKASGSKSKFSNVTRCSQYPQNASFLCIWNTKIEIKIKINSIIDNSTKYIIWNLVKFEQNQYTENNILLKAIKEDVYKWRKKVCWWIGRFSVVKKSVHARNTISTGTNGGIFFSMVHVTQATFSGS
jgi:hypothetical protein